MPYAHTFDPETELARQRRENVRDTEQRLVMMGDGRGNDLYGNLIVLDAKGNATNEMWVRDLGGDGGTGYAIGGNPYTVLPGIGPTPQINKLVWIKWQPGPKRWRVDISDPDYMDAVGQSMHLENPSAPENQFVRTEQLLPLRSQLIGSGKANVQTYQYVYNGIYYDYAGTNKDTHPDILAEAPGTDQQRYVMLAYNYELYTDPTDNPIELFVSTSKDAIADTLTYEDIQECIDQIDLKTHRPIWAYRVAGGDIELYGHADDRDLRFWPNVPDPTVITSEDDSVTITRTGDGFDLAVNFPIDPPGMTSFTISADAGTPEDVEDGDDVAFVGGDAIGTAVSSPDTITISVLDGGISDAKISDVAASKITGILDNAHGGTGADLSATGGAGQFLKQVTVGGVVTVAAITPTDLTAALTTPPPIGGTTPNTGAFLTVITTGDVRIGPAGAALSDARLVINAAASGKGLIVRANATTPGATVELQDSSGASTFSLDATTAAVQQLTHAGVMRFVATNPAINAVVFRAAPSHAGNLVSVTGNSGTPSYFNIDAVGQTIVNTHDAGTNAVGVGLIVRHSTSGTPAAGFGTALQFMMESSAADNRVAGLLKTLWNVATDSGAIPDVVLSAYYNPSGSPTEREGFRVRGGSGGVQTSVNGATPQTPPTYGAPTGTLTRTTFATGSVTLPQLAERVAALITDLRAFGVLA